MQRHRKVVLYAGGEGKVEGRCGAWGEQGCGEGEPGRAEDLPVHVADEVRVAELAHALPERHGSHAGEQRQWRGLSRREHDCTVDLEFENHNIGNFGCA